MTGYAVVFNPTDTPQPIDDEGRTLGGREWGVAHTSSDAAKGGLEGGRLAATDTAGDVPPPIVELRDRADELNTRAAAFGTLEPAQLRKIADDVELYQDPPDAAIARHKAELVHALTMHPSAKPPRVKE